MPLLLAVLLRCCEGAGVAGAELCLSVVVRPWSSPFGCVCQCLGSVRGRVALGDSGYDPTISISAYLPIRPSLPGAPAAAPPLGRYKSLSTP